MGVSESTFRKVAQVADELIRYSPATAAKIHQLGYDDVEKIEAQLKAIERPEYREQRERLERMNNIVKTSDMVCVVRCQDCIHCYYATNRIKSEQGYECSKKGLSVTPNWFCADGERKDV